MLIVMSVALLIQYFNVYNVYLSKEVSLCSVKNIVEKALKRFISSSKGGLVNKVSEDELF